MLIPDTYIRNMAERLSLYTELSKIENEDSLTKFSDMLIDRFGRYPQEVGVLLASIRVKWIGKSLGFEKIVLEKQNMKIYFPADEKAAFYDSAAFSKILQYIATQPAKFEMKQSSKTIILLVKSIKNIREATEFMEELSGLYV
jgi:transcription-repair coupling factor (superfamily II helicase)